MRKITRAVLGGSFDPVHNGHVAMARFVLDESLAQKVHVIPAGLSPFKSRTGAGAEHRLQMVRLAFMDLPSVFIEDLELEREGPSYTVDTLEELARRFPEDRLLLMVGQDNFAGLKDWKSPDRIGQLAQIAVLARHDDAGPDPLDKTGHLAGIPFQFFPNFHQPVSSTQVRAMLAGKLSGRQNLKEILPSNVVDHIRRHHLYEAHSEG